MCSHVAGESCSCCGSSWLRAGLDAGEEFPSAGPGMGPNPECVSTKPVNVWATKVSRAWALHPHQVSWTQPVFLTCGAQCIQQLCLHVLQLHLDLIQPEGELLWVTLCWSNQTAGFRLGPTRGTFSSLSKSCVLTGSCSHLCGAWLPSQSHSQMLQAPGTAELRVLTWCQAAPAALEGVTLQRQGWHTP